MACIRQFIKLVSTELKLFRREPEALFFTFVLPTFFLLLIMEVFVPDDTPKEVAINCVMPSLMVLIIAGAAIYSVPQAIVYYRKIKFIKRLQGSPITPVTILSSLAMADFIITIFGIILLTTIAVIVYDASLAGSLFSFFTGFIFVFLSLAITFLFIPAVARSPRAASVIGMFIYFPVMFFSGVFVPIDQLPEWIVRYISRFLPVTHAVELLQGLWIGTPLLDLTQEVFILVGILCLGLVIAARTFRWE